MKRLRDGTQVDHDLIKIYEDLASEDETTRLEAASRLKPIYFPSDDGNSNLDQKRTILIRLVKGLCSSRKAARLGFAIALTELLSGHTSNDLILRSQVIDILERHTRPESNTSGQDERDHYFGRLFGCEAIIKSEILFVERDVSQWDRLLDVICKIALQKPWLRQGCGWVMYSCVNTCLKSSDRQRFAVRILEKMTEHRLVRTPEGLAIWIAVRRIHPKMKLPQHIWKHDDPLSKNDLRTLANVLKDAKEHSKDSTEFEVQGSAMWAANLPFVWDVVLPELFVEAIHNDSKQKEYVQQFWQVAVDEALFSPSNSQERKHWGFLVMQKALSTADAQWYAMIAPIFSKNAVECLVQSLKTSDGYLQRSAQLFINKVQECILKQPKFGDRYVICLLKAVGMVDFDLVTRTKTIDSLISVCTPDALRKLAAQLNEDLKSANFAETGANTQQRRLILNHAYKLVTQQVHQALSKDDVSEEKGIIENVLVGWTSLVSPSSPFNESDKKLVLEKLQLALENLLKLGKTGRHMVTKLCTTSANEISEDTATADIIDVIRAGETRFRELERVLSKENKTNNSHNPSETEPQAKSRTASAMKSEGLALLYALVLFEIHTGDLEAIPILQDLLDLEAETTKNKKSMKDTAPENTDALVEIILSFASRPSKFLRRVTLTIFESFTSEITRDGLRSLTDILKAKETKAGQEELFEANGDEDVLEDSNEDEAEDLDSDVEMLDSDVEIISAADSTSSSDESASDSDSSNAESDHDSDAESTSSDGDAAEQDASLLALEASLATALGTRKLTQPGLDESSATSDSDSDADMTDSEMLALDDKLAEVFRARAETTSSSTAKKKERKSARVNIVNFKNRVLDMLESYIKKESLNPRCLELVLPLLALSRGQTKQLADRAVKILSLWCKKCHGLEKVPILTSTSHDLTNGASSKSSKKPSSSSQPNPSSYTSAEAYSLLREIHAEAGHRNTSNAHRATSSKTSILVVKTLLKAGTPIDDLQAVYDETEKRKTNDKDCHVQNGFFDDWKNWRQSVKGRVEKS